MKLAAPTSSLVACLTLAAAGVLMAEPLPCVDYGRTRPPTETIASGVTNVCARADLVFVAAGARGVDVHRVRVSDELRPLATIPIDGVASLVAADERLIGVVIAGFGVRLFEASSGGYELVGQLPTPVPVRAIALEGRLLVLQLGSTTQIIDISTPSSMRGIGGATTSGRDVLVRDDRVAVAGDGLTLMDLSTGSEASVLRVSEDELGGGAFAVALSGNIAYVGGEAGAGGFIATVRLGTSEATLADRVPVDSPVRRLEVVGSVLYALTDSQLIAYSLAAPAYPSPHGSHTHDGVRDIALGEYVFAVTVTGTLESWSPQCTVTGAGDLVSMSSMSSTSIRVSPNPLVGATRIQHDAPDGTRVRIFSTSGRLVRELTLVAATASWDGRDTLGRRVPNGVFYVDVEGGSRRKILVTR